VSEKPKEEVHGCLLFYLAIALVGLLAMLVGEVHQLGVRVKRLEAVVSPERPPVEAPSP
jgi:hypothetical protein